MSAPSALTMTAVLVEAKDRGFDFWTGVPCSFLTPIINGVINDDDAGYVGATSEGEAVAIAAGAWLAGRRTVVMCQNSGLGNAVNPLTSLNWPFRIPTLLLVTWRGKPGLADEPQHELMGQITDSLLAVMQIPHEHMPSDRVGWGRALEGAVREIDQTALPFALIVSPGTVAAAPLEETVQPSRPRGEWIDLNEASSRPRRVDVLSRLLETVPEGAAIVATTGKCGRELFTLADREQHLYQVGSMGGASAMGLGVALNTQRPVIVLDGDGAALMKMGNLATIGTHAPANLIHIVLDNGVHDSTGGQATVSANVNFAEIACNCGYRGGVSADSLPSFEQGLALCLDQPGPSLLHVRIAPGSIAKLGRPTVTPRDVARRFKDFLARPQ